MDINVSVIVPVYNNRKHLSVCLDSLVNQTLKNIEIIVVNDGSTDNSLDIMKEYAIKYSTIEIIDSPNCGAGGARNKGLAIAKGEYISFIDSDDFLVPNALKIMYNECEKNKANISRVSHLKVGRFFDKVDYSWLPIKENRIIIPSEDKSYLVKEAPGPCNKMFRSDLIKNFTFPEKTKWEDVAVVFPAIVTAEKIAYIHQPLYCYRQTRGQASSQQVRNANSKINDIFTDLDISDKRIKEANKYNQFEHEILSFNMLHSLYRVCDTTLWPMKIKDKLILTSLLLKLIEVKYGRWQDNEYIVQYCKDCLPWGLSLNFFERNKKSISITGEQELKNEISNVFIK